MGEILFYGSGFNALLQSKPNPDGGHYFMGHHVKWPATLCVLHLYWWHNAVFYIRKNL